MVDQGENLAYTHEVFRYDKAYEATTKNRKYQTDLLVYDTHENEDWIPRVVLVHLRGRLVLSSLPRRP
jgi:hypothetical protein